MPVKLGDKYFLNEKVQSNEEKFEIIFSYLLSCYATIFTTIIPFSVPE